MKTLLFFFIIFITIGLPQGNAQERPRRIEIKINQLKDTTLILGHYFNKQMLVDDTVQINSSGVAVFEGEKPLPGGIYVVYLPDKRYFDLLIDDEQTFSVTIDTTDFVHSMQIEGARQPILFNNYQRFIMARQKEATALQSELQSAANDPGKNADIREKLQAVNLQVKNYWDDITQKYPGTMLSLFVKGIQDVAIPQMDPPSGSSNPDSVLRINQYNYYKNHYFDNIDLTDPRILRTPFFTNRLENYFTKVILQMPDTVLRESVKIIEKSRPNGEMFRYMVQYLFNMTNSSQIMGMDAAMVGLAERYYLSGEAPWADEAFLKNLAERVEELKPTLIGQQAHDLKMPSLHGEYFRLLEVNAPVTVLLFWEPECGHCKKEVPALHKLLKEQLAGKGVKVFAVYTQFNKEEWLEFIDEHQLYDFINVYDPSHQSFFRTYYDIKSTPVVYVLNKNKTIIGKRIAVEDLPGFIDHYLTYGPK